MYDTYKLALANCHGGGRVLPRSERDHRAAVPSRHDTELSRGARDARAQGRLGRVDALESHGRRSDRGRFDRMLDAALVALAVTVALMLAAYSMWSDALVAAVMGVM